MSAAGVLPDEQNGAEQQNAAPRPAESLPSVPMDSGIWTQREEAVGAPALGEGRNPGAGDLDRKEGLINAVSEAPEASEVAGTAKDAESTSPPHDGQAAAAPSGSRQGDRTEDSRESGAPFQERNVWIPLQKRLSFKQARNTVLIALGLGLILSGLQILIDFTQVEKETDGLIEQVLSSLKEPAAEAAYGLDDDMAQRVVNGLFEYRPIYYAEVRDDFGHVLAKDSRSLAEGKRKWIVDQLFEPSREYSIALELTGPDAENKYVGRILVRVDSYLIAADFLDRSFLIITTGVVRNIALAGILMLMFYFGITKPFLALTQALSRVDPSRPAEHLLPIPSGHKDDEVGVLVASMNNLLRQFDHSLLQRDQAKAQLMEREARLRGIMENVADGILTLNSSGIIESINPAAERLFGYSRDEVVQGPASRLVSGSDWDVLSVIIKNSQQSSDPAVFAHAPEELTGVRRDGSSLALSLSISRMSIGGGDSSLIFVMRDITQRKRFEEQLMYMATHDPLTDLPNRTLLQDRLAHALTHARRRDHYVAVLFLDLDRFKLVNDTLGHDIGDRLLESVALRLSNTVRPSDTVGRLGGDEFLVIADDLDGPAAAARNAQMLLDSLSRPFNIDGNQLFITPSIGISVYPGDGTDIQTLLRHADTAMYSAKAEGGNTYQYFIHKMNQEAVDRLSLEHSLREAVEKEQFMLYYQPKVDAVSLEPVGVEALIRWKHPEAGFIAPNKFIPIAEETGLILQIGEWVLRTALAQIQEWWDQGKQPLPVAVNLSARQITAERPVEGLRQMLETCTIPAEMLELEITETVMMSTLSRTVEVLGEFQSMGLRIAIDDFGTGYSSLAYLRRLPINSLKVDKSFIADACRNADDASIASTIIAMGQRLGLKVIAEGIETEDQLEFLRQQGCDIIQGYYISRPLPARDLEERFLKDRNA